jgi:hypothetical protein
LKGLPEGDALRRAQLDSLITMAELAERVAPGRVGKLPLAEVVTIADRLFEHKYELPDVSLREMAVSYGKLMFGAGKYDQWASHFVMSARSDSEFDYESPSLAVLLPRAKAGVDLDGHRTSYYQLFFCDPSMELVMSVSFDGSGTNAKLLSALAALLSVFDSDTVPAAAPPSMKQARDDIRATSRGMVSLLSPIPGHLGASPSDVDFLALVSKRKKKDDAVVRTL